MMYHAIVFLPLIGALIAGLFGTALFKNFGHDKDVYAGHHDSHGHHGDHDHDDHGHGGH
jgi:NADH-quinone oxidoreductase subunit L